MFIPVWIIDYIDLFIFKGWYINTKSNLNWFLYGILFFYCFYLDFNVNKLSVLNCEFYIKSKFTILQ